MSDVNTDIPPIPQPLADLRVLAIVARALKEGMEVLSGTRGSKLGRAITFADLTAYVFTSPTVKATLVSQLPVPPTLGMLACVTDSTVNTWGSTIAGGGQHTVLAWYNGTAWTVWAV